MPNTFLVYTFIYSMPFCSFAFFFWNSGPFFSLIILGKCHDSIRWVHAPHHVQHREEEKGEQYRPAACWLLCSPRIKAYWPVCITRFDFSILPPFFLASIVYHDFFVLSPRDLGSKKSWEDSPPRNASKKFLIYLFFSILLFCVFL